MNRPNRRPVEMGGERQGRGRVEGSEARHLCLWMGEGVRKRFGLNWWGIGRGRAIERCDGGGHHGFHAFCEMAFLTISKATEHLGRIFKCRGLPYACPKSPTFLLLSIKHWQKSSPRGGRVVLRWLINCAMNQFVSCCESAFLLEGICKPNVSKVGVF